jgi:hypothetical protein
MKGSVLLEVLGLPVAPIGGKSGTLR